MDEEAGWTAVGSATNAKDVSKPKRVDRSVMLKKACLKRLMRDWKELAANPIPNCSAQPLEKDIREWHVNLRITEIEGPWNQTIVHLELHFPEDYPMSPPTVICRSGIPHANCVPKGGHWEICADIFQTGDWSTESQKARQYTGWTSAYSVTTILLQLQVLALDKRGFRMNHHGLTPEQARERLGRFKCIKCDHKFDDEEEVLKVWPPLQEDVSTTLADSVDSKASSEAESQASSDEDEFDLLPCCPTVQPVVQGNLSTYDKLRRLDAHEQRIMGWVCLNTEADKSSEALQKTEVQEGTPPKQLDPVKMSVPRNIPVWAKTKASENWRHAVLVEQKPDLSVVVRFPNKTVFVLHTSLVSVPKPIQAKFNVTAAGVSKASLAKKSASKVPAFDRIRLVNANTRPALPIWGRFLGNWYQSKLLANMGNGSFKIKIKVGGCVKVDRKDIRIPEPLITMLTKNFRGQINCHPPRCLILPRNTMARVLPNADYKELTNSGLRKLDVSSNLDRFFPAMIVKDHTTGRYEVQWNDYKKKPEKVTTVQILIMPKTQKKLAMILRGQDPNKVEALPKKVLSVAPALTEENKSEMTSDAGNSEFQADPFHMVEKLNVGDEVIVRKKSNMGTQTLAGKIKSVGNHHLFGVVFDGKSEKQMEFVNRSQVLYYKLTQTPVAEFNVDATKGFIMQLGPNAMFHILSFCTCREVSRLATTCKDINQVAKKSFLWRVLYQRNFGGKAKALKALLPSQVDWRHQYMLENEQILQALRCFYTKKPFHETILGIPLEWTQNPRTKRIDYISSTCDLISVEAVDFMQLRTTLWKKKFTDWLPVYINHHHFKRALPRIKKTIRTLATKSNNAKWRHSKEFKSGMVLDVLPQLLKTFVILISDRGLESSEEALTGYCTVHRLFIALALEFPALRTAINERVGEFIKSDKNRSKTETPDLGNFVTLLSVCDKYSFRDACGPYLRESFARSVLWACRKYPGLHDLKTGASKVETDRIERMWECSRVGGRHLLFNVYFLTKFCRNRTMHETSQYYDRFFGRPARSDMREFQKAVARIMQCHDADLPENWDQFFKLIGLRAVSKEKLTAMLRDAVKSSVKKRYTNNKMDFGRIHKSGVSKILLAGESYSVSPTIKKLKVEDVWQYKANVGTQYVDFSMLAINYDNVFVRYVDWSTTDWHDSKGNEISHHSSDIYYRDQCKGKQLMTVHLNLVPMSVHRLVFTGSTWRGTFSEIIDTDVLLTDEAGNEICCGRVNDVGSKNPEKTMCCMGELVRTEPGKSKWEFVMREYVGFGTTHGFNHSGVRGYATLAKNLQPKPTIHPNLKKDTRRLVCECAKKGCTGNCVAGKRRGTPSTNDM